MAKNTGDGHRVGAVKGRTQLLTKNGVYMKRNADGKFMSGKTTPYKGVTKESTGTDPKPQTK
jgi:hypothetical protein